jgi:phage tail-like protein
MLTSHPRSWLLNGTIGWRTGPDPLVATPGSPFDPGMPTRQVTSASGPLRLAALPDGPLGLLAGQDRADLGGLVLPRGFAFDRAWTLHLLKRSDGTIHRFDPVTREFAQLPALGGIGQDARQFRAPATIAIAGTSLYVLDDIDSGNCARIAAFDLRTFALEHEWVGSASRPWSLVNIATDAHAMYALDVTGAVYRHRPRRDRLECVVEPVQASGAEWTGIAIDRHGRIYLFDRQSRRLAQVSSDGKIIDWYADASEVRGRFETPPIRLDGRGQFCLPPSLAQGCDRRPADPSARLEDPLELCRLSGSCGLVFDVNGMRVNDQTLEPVVEAIYPGQGAWISTALDSRLQGCQWHRIAVGIGSLPPGTRVDVATYASDTKFDDAFMQRRAAELWDRGATFESVWHRPGDVPSTGAGARDCLVQSHPGQYLWIRLVLAGDQTRTPEIDSIEIEFPRESYLQYLPAVFSEDDESRWFLERFLSIFQTDWDELEQTIADRHRYTNPASVPDGPFLSYLASWLGLPLEGSWDDAQKRNLLEAAPKIYPIRGTIDGLRDYVRVYLENITGLDGSSLAQFPQVVEGYRERDHLVLGANQGTLPGMSQPLWSPDVVNRLQLGVDARADEGRLLGAGTPELDLFDHYAHRFRVFVPAVWVATDEAERLVRHALDEEKPAHTQYELCLVESRFQLGLQSTLGFDTIVGDYPNIRLGCLDCGSPAPRQRPRNRLGNDTILGCPHDDERFDQLAPGVRLGAALAAQGTEGVRRWQWTNPSPAAPMAVDATVW